MMVNDNIMTLSSPDSEFKSPLNISLVSPKLEMPLPASKPKVAVSMVLIEDKTEIIETEVILDDDFDEKWEIPTIKQEKDCTITNLTCQPPNDHPKLKVEVDITQELVVNIVQSDLEKLSKDTKCRERKRSATLQNGALSKRTIKREASNDVETDIKVDKADNSDWIVKNEEVHIKYEEGEDDRLRSSSIDSSRRDNTDNKHQTQQSIKKSSRPSKKGRHLGQRIHYCRQCGYETPKLSLLKKHTIFVHEKGEGLEKHSCSKCAYQTIHKQVLAQHIRSHDGDVVIVKFQRCPTCEHHTSRKNGLADHACRKEVLTCYDCGYQTLMKNNLRKHVSCHSPTKYSAFNCNVCSFETKYKSHLTIHMLRHNINDERKYKCTKCDYQTNQRYNLTRHGLVHKANKNATTYSCYHCDFRTYLKSSLKRHILRHNKRDYEAAKTIKCSECNYKCFQRWDLKLHLLRHKIGIPTKKCDRCEYSTMRNSSLMKHKLTHNRK